MQRPDAHNCQLSMRYILTACIVLSASAMCAQENRKLLLSLQLQPEQTYHKNNYSYRWRETYTKTTFNTGIEANIQYYFSKRLFTEIGLGYISRRLNTTVFLNQAALPPPRRSMTLELVAPRSVSFRTIQFPLNFGYNMISKKKLNLFLNAGVEGNYLLNTYYDTFEKYKGTYAKGYWQGYTVNLGSGMDYHIAKKIMATGRLTYSVINTVQKDAYLNSQDKYGIPLPYTYLRLSMGVRIVLE